MLRRSRFIGGGVFSFHWRARPQTDCAIEAGLRQSLLLCARPMTIPAAAPILSAAAMRAAELAMTARGVSLAQLMERAGAAVADIVWRAAAGREILILCGPGNNGGDGYVAARLLAERGAAVRVAASGKPSTDLARAAALSWQGRVERIDEARVAPVLVDALFGVGLTRPLTPEQVAALGRLAQGAARRIAIDIPSGVASDSGASLSIGPDYDITVALGALKPAHVLMPAAARCGVIHLADIGIAVSTLVTTLGDAAAPPPHAASHKYNRGQVLVIAGPMSGAAQLAAMAALRAGAGYGLLHGEGGAGGALAVVNDALPLGQRLRDRRVGAIVLGPGSAAGTELDAQVAAVVVAGKALVLDADAIAAALPLLGAAPMLRPPAILTPHGGEFDRIFGPGGGSKLDRTLAASKATGAVVIHKGADTIIAAPDGRAAAAWPGSPHLASAGTGDVLAGACGAMLAQGLVPFEAACSAVRWHIARAHRTGPGLIADDLVMA
jgi:ADP-dependent NAD(P)H-hydrate dehydratase / NAD(P)H-hydrate epimerase